jgi:exonuclease SbcC
MIRRISLENYMSHSHTIIEPAAGLTVLVGPNNCGKSAVVSALETLCNNASGDYMVRHDEKEASVTVETDEDHTFVWRRGKNVSYVIDGREINRLKRDIPDDLHKLLRLPKVDAGEKGDPFDIHFGTQKSPIFLLNEPESRAALFFASSSDTAILLEMQKRHRNKVKERKSDKTRLQGEIEKLDAELAALAPLDTLAASIERTEVQYQKLKELEGQVYTLGQEWEALRAHSLKYDRLVQEYQCLAPLEPIPDLADPSLLESLIDDLVNAERQLQRESARHSVLESLDAPPALDDVEKLESLCRALSHEEEKNCKLMAKAVCLGLLNDPPALDDTSPLEKIVADLESAQLAYIALCKQQRVLESLSLPPELADSKPLAELIRQMEVTLRAVDEYEASITTTAADMAKLEADIGSAERLGPDSFLSGLAERRRRIFMALGGSAGMVAVILFFIFGPAWFSRPDTGSSDRTEKMVDLTAMAVVKVDGGKIRKVPESQQAAEKETPKNPKKEEPNEARQLRLKEVRNCSAMRKWPTRKASTWTRFLALDKPQSFILRKWPKWRALIL